MGQDKPNADQKTIQGAWKVIMQKPEAKGVALEKLIINENKMSFHYKLGERFAKPNDTVETEFKLDPTTSPKQIEFSAVAGPNKGKLYLGIYEINGDKLRICYRGPGKARPKDINENADYIELQLIPPS
jgi:uncharacterized protein (TIGR03067 family)